MRRVQGSLLEPVEQDLTHYLNLTDRDVVLGIVEDWETYPFTKIGDVFVVTPLVAIHNNRGDITVNGTDRYRVGDLEEADFPTGTLVRTIYRPASQPFYGTLQRVWNRVDTERRRRIRSWSNALVTNIADNPAIPINVELAALRDRVAIPLEDELATRKMRWQQAETTKVVHEVETMMDDSNVEHVYELGSAIDGLLVDVLQDALSI
jgi:hypothetical protein